MEVLAGAADSGGKEIGDLNLTFSVFDLRPSFCAWIYPQFSGTMTSAVAEAPGFKAPGRGEAH